MIYLAYISIGFALLQFVVSLINLVFWQKLHKTAYTSEELVSVLIPARNEERHIADILADLQNLTHKNLEVIVFDDMSTDATADIVSGFAKQDERIKLIQSQELPKGWLGKNFACHSMAQQASGSHLLFVDADVRLNGSIIEESLDFALKHKIALLSIFPTQEMLTIGEKQTVPLMNYILLTLLPLILVRKSAFPSLSAANGQFMMFDASKYKVLNPHELFKKSPVEDIIIARHFKKIGLKIACLLGESNISCRMYESHRQAFNGFTKNIRMLFGNSTLLALLFWILTTIGFIPVLMLGSKYFISYVAVVVATRILVSIASKQSLLDNLIFLIPQQISLLLIIINSIISKQLKNYQWKGRKIY